jgi:hypothetical protein
MPPKEKVSKKGVPVQQNDRYFQNVFIMETHLLLEELRSTVKKFKSKDSLTHKQKKEVEADEGIISFLEIFLAFVRTYSYGGYRRTYEKECNNPDIDIKDSLFSAQKIYQRLFVNQECFEIVFGLKSLQEKFISQETRSNMDKGAQYTLRVDF